MISDSASHDERIEELQRMLAQIIASQRLLRPGAPLNDPQPRVFLARNTESGKQWIEQTVDGITLVDYLDGRFCDNDSDTAALIDPADAFAVIELDDIDAGNPVKRYVRIAGGNLFVLRLSAIRGTGGGTNTPPDYVYHATHAVSNAEFGTDLSPLWRRTIGLHNPANYGIGFFDSNGDPALLICDEVPVVAECTIPEASAMYGNELDGAASSLQRFGDLEEPQSL